MKLAELIAKVPKEKLEAFMTHAREGNEEVDVRLLEAMLEDGLTPWQAAVRVGREMTLSEHTTYYRARGMVREILDLGQFTVEDYYQQLKDQGWVEGVPGYLMADLRRVAEEEGLKLEEVTLVRVVSGNKR